MKIYLNNKEMENEYKFMPLDELFTYIQKNLKDKIVKVIKVDGVEIKPKDFCKMKKDNINSIRFITQETKELIKETLVEVENYLPRLKEGILDLAELYRNGKLEKTNQKYQLIVDGVEWYVSVMNKIISLKESNEDDEDTIDQYFKNMQRLNKFLEEIVIAKENDDFILIADIFRYEIVDVIENFRQINKKLGNIYCG
ncbi:MAG: hypothetical protein ACOCRX_05380 [Candidatus Woesearchaeota archaeon]